MTRNKKDPENKSWANQQEMNYGLTVHYVTNVGYLERQKNLWTATVMHKQVLVMGSDFIPFHTKKMLEVK